MVHHKEVLNGCSRGARAIDAIMQSFKKHMADDDWHWMECKEYSKWDECNEHVVIDTKRLRIAGLSSRIVTGIQFERFNHLSLFLQFRLPNQRVKNLFHSLDELEGFTDLFIVENGELALGPLFDADPRLKCEAEVLLHLLHDAPSSQVGKEFWQFIMNQGGIITLVQMGRQIYEAVILPRLIEVDA